MTARRVVHPLLLTFGALLLVAACTGGSPEAESLAISQHAAPESIVEDPAIGAAITDSPPVPSLSSTTETAGNLIRNPGFEAGLIEWRSTRFINPADSATYHPAVGRSISGATSAAGVEAQPGNLGRLYQDVTARVVVGRTYEIGGWIRTEGVEGEVVIGLDYVRADGWTPGAGSYVREVGRLTGTRDWTYFESDPFVLPPAPPEAGASALWFLFDFNNGSGTAWWDDVFLRELDHAAAASGCLNSASLLTARRSADWSTSALHDHGLHAPVLEPRLALAAGQTAFAQDRANLRGDRSRLATRVGQIRGTSADNAEVRILDGPWCGPDFVWWLVESRQAAVANIAGQIDDGFERGTVTGWIAEVDQYSRVNLASNRGELGGHARLTGPRLVEEAVVVAPGFRGLVAAFCGPGEVVTGGGYEVQGDGQEWAATGSYPRWSNFWGWAAEGWNQGSRTIRLTAIAMCTSS